MARPNVTVIVDDQSFVVPPTEIGSVTRGGMVSYNGLITHLGNTAERKRGIMEIASVNDLIEKLNSPDPVGAGISCDRLNETYLGHWSTYERLGKAKPYTAGGTAARWPGGPTGNWRNEFFAAHNYLQYGGVLVVAGTGSDFNTTVTSTSTPLHNKEVDIDVVFAALGGNTGITGHAGGLGDFDIQVSTVSNIANTRQDVVGVVPDNSLGGFSGDAGTISGDAIVPAGVSPTEFTICGYGMKRHLDVTRGSDLNSNSLVNTSVCSDIAGCISRNDRLGHPWTSPAGFVRGQILDVYDLVKNPTDAEQDTLYDRKINPVVTFPGEGTVLFGDKTGKDATSTMSRINVSRLFIYLKKTIGQAARSLLFKQNDEITRAQFVNAVTPILNRVKATRGISDFRVVCDETNNLPAMVDANQFIADVFIKPTTSINYIHLTFTNKNSDAVL
jgi:hypothetical protein